MIDVISPSRSLSGYADFSVSAISLIASVDNFSCKQARNTPIGKAALPD